MEGNLGATGAVTRGATCAATGAATGATTCATTCATTGARQSLTDPKGSRATGSAGNSSWFKTAGAGARTTSGRGS